jgi:hypothetical protein
MKNNWEKNLIILTIIGLVVGSWGMYQRLFYGHLGMNYGSFVPWGLWVAFGPSSPLVRKCRPKESFVHLNQAGQPMMSEEKALSGQLSAKTRIGAMWPYQGEHCPPSFL